MNSIHPILQFEVYYLSEGRWSLHARYPSAERQEAIKDAMTTEGSFGYPTKVVRETYFPESNSSETVTIYASPKLKSMVRVPATPSDIARMRQRAEANKQQKPRVATRAQPVNLGEYVADLLTRAVIASLLSMGAAVIVTGVVSWLLSNLDKFGISLAADTVSNTLTFTTVAMFILGFFAFFRVGRSFKRFIKSMWSKSVVKPAEQSTTVIARQMSMSPKSIRPKHPSRKAMESERTMQEVKRQRGDLDTIEPDSEEMTVTVKKTEPPAKPKAKPEMKKTDGHVATDQKKREDKESKRDKPTATKDDTRNTEQGAAREEPQKAGKQTEVPPAQRADEPAFETADAPYAVEKADQETDTDDEPDGLELQRLLVARFAAERVRPLSAGQTDDPMTRRGVALVMAGAVSHVAATSQLNLLAQERLLQFGLKECNLAQASIDAFITHRNDPNDRDTGWRLQDAGRSEMAEFLSGSPAGATLGEAWQAWRMPLTAPKADNEKSADFTAPRDIYLATELRGTDQTTSLDYHNRMVRSAIEESGGLEIKHTGHGILAKFDSADAAIVAAISIAEDTGLTQLDPETPAGNVVAMVPGYSADDDPLMSPQVMRVAQALAAEAQPGEIATEHAVVSHLERGLPPGYYADESRGVAVILRRGAAPKAALSAVSAA